MDEKLQDLARSMIRTEREGRVASVSLALRNARAEFAARGALGHSHMPVTLDRSAAEEFDHRAKSYIDIVKRIVAETEMPWTEQVALSAIHLLKTELAVDSEELIAALARTVGPRQKVRIDALESIKSRVNRTIEDETALAVIKEDRGRLPLADLLGAPRYAAVLSACRKAKDYLARESPDFANAAKEAVGAVEALARIVVAEPKLTLGECIKRIRASDLLSGPTLKGLEEIWGISSDTPGVRHGAAATDLDAAASRYIYDLAQAALRLLLSVDTL